MSASCSRGRGPADSVNSNLRILPQLLHEFFMELSQMTKFSFTVLAGGCVPKFDGEIQTMR